MAQVTSDGRFLAFDSVASLTGYDNTVDGPICPVEGEAKTCPEVFEYDSAAEKRHLRVVQPHWSPSGGPLDALAAAADRVAVPAAAQPHPDRPSVLRQLRCPHRERSLAGGRERLRVRSPTAWAAVAARAVAPICSPRAGYPRRQLPERRRTREQRLHHDSTAAAAGRRPRRTRRPVRRA